MIDIDAPAEDIRKMLSETHGLHLAQLAALPTPEKAFEIAFGLMGELIPMMFMQMIPEEMQRMETDTSHHAIKDEGDAIDWLMNRPPIKVTFGAKEKRLMGIVEKLGHFTISQTSYADFDTVAGSEERKIREEKDRHHALDAYEEICAVLIEDRNKTDAGKSPLGRLLLTFFRMPSDAQALALEAPNKPRSRNRRKRHEPKA